MRIYVKEYWFAYISDESIRGKTAAVGENRE